MNRFRIVHICGGAFLVQGQSSNWVIVKDSSGQGGFTLIDCGYPEEYGSLLGSIKNLGLRPQRCEAILVTHGHVDHIGSLPEFVKTFGTPVLCHSEESNNLVGPVREQVTLAQVLACLWRPAVRRWLRTAISLGGLRPVSIAPTSVFEDGDILDVPGAPKVIHCPGHTAGSSAFLFNIQGQRVLVSGDSVVTGHEMLDGALHPRLLPQMFSHDIVASEKSLSTLLSLAPDALVPGHGGALWLVPKPTHLVNLDL